MKTIKGNLILTKDTTFDESIKVEGDIIGDYNLIVKGSINARNIDALYIKAWNIDARNIDAWDIYAWDIDARNIDAWNIDARNIDAWDIYAWDIDARNIDARNIDYYAVCFAYNNIKCKSIKGRKKNCKHFVLDGEIIIEEKKVCEKCGRELE